MRFKYGMLFALFLTALVVMALSLTPSAKSENEAGQAEEALGSDRVELPGKRTETSDTYKLSSGALEAEIFASPVNYEAPDGSWQPIEEDLEEQPDGSGLTNGANSFDLTLPDRLGSGGVRLQTKEGWVASKLLGPASEPAEVAGNEASYEIGEGGTTFDLASVAAGVKESIRLEDPLQPRRYRFRLETSAGVTPALTPDGSVAFSDQTGELVAEMPAPVLYDSSPQPQSSREAHYELDQAADGSWNLTVDADSAWLSDPDRQWPVTIDPSLFQGNPDRDCLISAVEKSGGGLTAPDQRCKFIERPVDQLYFNRSATGDTSRSRALLHFNVLGIPSQASVASASLNLYQSSVASVAPEGVQVKALTHLWDNNATWLKYAGSLWATPGGDFNSEGSELLQSAFAEVGWRRFESTEMRAIVQRWVANSSANYGLIAKLKNESACSATCNRGEFNFYSAGKESFKPYISVLYYPHAPAGSKVTSPSDGVTTARRLKLKAAWASETAGVTGVRFQYRAGKKGAFEDIPTNLVRTASGQNVAEWPIPWTEGPHETEPLYFDAAHATSELRQKGGSIQVRALFIGVIGVEGYSDPVEAKINRTLGGPKDATAPVGPGTLDLLTGNLNLTKTDVSIPGFNSAIEFARSYNTREPGNTGDTGVLGQGWKPGAPVEEAGGSEWRSARVVAESETIEEVTYTFEYALLTDIEGAQVGFEKTGETYVTPPEMTGYSLVAQGTNQLVLTDPGGNRTTFENEGGGSEFLPVSITQAGSNPNATKLVYHFIGGQRRLTMVIAPTPAGVEECNETTATSREGCHAVAFNYAPASKWGAPSNYGERLSTITYYAPGSGGPWDVAAYAYDSSGRLTEEWDPRIGSSIKETYTYEGEKLRKVTPPGQEPWTLRYTTAALDGESGPLRLKGVERSDLLGGESKTSIRYEVPLSGSGAPYEMGGASVATWGQSDIPTDATAVFPPSEVPAEPAASYQRATIHYMDSEGFAVNTATPAGAGTSGASIATAETDEFGNVVRELTAQNRLRALAAGSESVTRSHQLETKRTYNTTGTKLQEERGPLHQVTLESGTVTQARLHKTIQYDEGMPPGTSPDPLLPTRVTTGASIPGKGEDQDQRVNETRYDWTLRKPTETIVDAGSGHLAITSKTFYDPTTGLPTEMRQPSNPGGGGAGTTKIVYYHSGGSGGECESNRWANLPCKTMPAAQASGAGRPELLVKQFKSYNQLDQPTEILESPGGGTANTRRSAILYDSAGRQKTKKIEGGGSVIPKSETTYSSTNGMPIAEKFTCPPETECDTQAVTTTYDALGRVTSYEDADGNKATTTYDTLSRPVTTSDGKGSQTIRYDSVTGLPVELTDSAAGTFTASYDADGNLVERRLPDGLTAVTTFDEAGQPVHLTYTKQSFCGVSCTWLDFGLERSIYGQILGETGTLGTDRFGYDKAGRLISAQEIPAGGPCTTRAYTYDADSNRKSLTTRSPGVGGVCATSGGTPQNYSYDAADRLEGPIYDEFGRITSLPAEDAGGKALTTSYFANDMVATQSQGGITNTFELDASLRQRSRMQAGGLEGTEVFHYDSTSDSPAWTERGSAWTRSIVGIGGELAAVQESGTEITLQLTDLHGDVSATVGINPEITELKQVLKYDEFGNPTSEGGARYGWLGGKQRRTELPSGVIQMGARSYVPSIGRFVSPDPVRGGSANAYDYANADPLMGLDLAGLSPSNSDCDPGIVGCQCKMWSHLKKGRTRGTFYLTVVRKCNRFGGITLQGVAAGWKKRSGPSAGWHGIPPPRRVFAQIEPACIQLNAPCQNYQKQSILLHCEPGKEYQLNITWGYVYNLNGDGAEHYLDNSVDQTCPRGSI